MRLLQSTLIALLAGGLLATGVVAAPADPFKGAWVSIDVVDDSNQRLTFGGGGDTRRITLRDQDATVACGGGPAIVRGTGTISGDSITGNLSIRCANGNEAADAVVTFTYNSGTNTLADNFGTTWTRH
jgi:hypothetical protein